MTLPPRTLPIKLLLTTLLALSAAVTMGTAATVFAASDVARRTASPTTRSGVTHGSDPSLRTRGRDLGDGSLRAVAANRSLPAAVRLAAVRDALFGGCQNTREVLLGATPTRREALQAIVGSIGDLPRAVTIAPLTLRALDLFSAGAAPDAAARQHAEADWTARLAWIIPSRVRNRRAFCERY